MRYLLILLLLGGCASQQPPPTIIETPVIISHPLLPEPLKLEYLEPLVLTKAYVDYEFTQNPELIYIAMTTSDYEKLLTNMVQIEGYILELHNIIRAYRDAVNSYSKEP